MLEDDEWEVIQRAGKAAGHRLGAEAARNAMAVLEEEAHRRNLPAPPTPPPDARPDVPALWYLRAGYQMFTGVEETNPNAVLHHVLSRFGPPCASCGRPLRTPEAQLCADCPG